MPMPFPITLSEEDQKELEALKKKMDADPVFAKKILMELNAEMKKFISETN
jgi:hypothetical protein